MYECMITLPIQKVRFSTGDKSDIDIKLGPGNTPNKTNKMI